MKKALVLMAFATLLILGFSSCKKMMCKCVATGYVSEAELETILNKHINDCVEIAETGSITDQGVVVTCSY